MIDIAYNQTWLYNLDVVRHTKQWYQKNLISEEQFLNIAGAYSSSLYSPNFIIRIILFVASVLALAGITGLLALMVIDGGEQVGGIASVIYAMASFVILDIVFIKNHKHYKSGVTEAILYHSIGFVILGFALITDGNERLVLIIAIPILIFTSIRYLDLLSTLCALIFFSWLMFLELYAFNDIVRQVIPFAFVIAFYVLYQIIKRTEARKNLYFWRYNLLVVKVFSLIMVYVSGNYFVVRELSVEMMGTEISEGGDIPYAIIFYAFTILIPIAYLYFGIKRKDVVLLRISLVLIAFSAFTFKYYYSFGHPEITLTVAGSAVSIVALILLNYLKTMKYGYTRENILSQKWSNLNVEAFIVSQTMGGNQIDVADQQTPGGGSFGGGGSSDSF
jgi:hypothetical protein